MPHTWAQFISTPNTAKAKGVAPFAVGGKDQWPLTQWTDSVLLRVAGATAFNDPARGKIGWGVPRIVNSFQVFASMIKSWRSPYPVGKSGLRPHERFPEPVSS